MNPTFLTLKSAESTVRYTVKVFFAEERHLIQTKNFSKEESVLDFVEDLITNHPLYDFSVYKTEKLSVISEDEDGNEIKF